MPRVLTVYWRPSPLSAALPLRGTVEVAEIVTEVGGRLRGGATQDPRQPPHRRAATGGGRGAGRPPADAGPTGRLVFTAPKGGGPLRVIAFRARIWRPATRTAGLDGLRIHDLRHTAVALWIAAGANPKEVAARAGHTSVIFTLDRYGHLYRSRMRPSASGWDAIYSAGQFDRGSVVVRLPRKRPWPQRGSGSP
jgi:hypothetical protein